MEPHPALRVPHPLEDRDLVDLEPGAHLWAVSHEQAVCVVASGRLRALELALSGAQLARIREGAID